jgi:hypothetical protein
MNLSSVPSIVLFAAFFTGVARSSDPKLQQICTTAVMCLLAVGSSLSGRSPISNHILRSIRHTGEMIVVRLRQARPVEDWLT